MTRRADGFVLWHALRYANAQFCEMSGYERREIYGRNCRFLQGPATAPEHGQHLLAGRKRKKRHAARTNRENEQKVGGGRREDGARDRSPDRTETMWKRTAVGNE